MQVPIDIKDVMSAATDIDTARLMPVSVIVCEDATSPEDVRAFARSLFATEADNALVNFVSFGQGGSVPTVPAGIDLAVIVAGFSENTGAISKQARRAGVPVMVVTTMPEITIDLAKAARTPLLSADVLSPVGGSLDIDDASDSQEALALVETGEEPYELDDVRSRVLADRMGSWIVDTFKEKRLAFALCFSFVRKPLALECVNATSVQNAGIGAALIIPGADMPVMTANQAKMMLQIAAAYGQKMGLERIKELAGVVGGAFALRAVARQLLSVVPIGGWIVKGGIGYAGTQAMGRAAIVYFDQTVGDGRSLEDAMAAAKAEAARVADVFASAQNPADAAMILARGYADRMTKGAMKALKSAIPVVKNTVPTVKQTVERAAEAAGVDPSEVAKKVAKQAWDAYRNRKA